MIEVLISLLLLSCILMGFDAFHIHTMKGMRNVFYFMQAVNQITSMEERLRALENHFGLNEQISVWNSENKKVLPKGVGEVSGRYPEYIIRIYWGKAQSECENMRLGDFGCLKENFKA